MLKTRREGELAIRLMESRKGEIRLDVAYARALQACVHQRLADSENIPTCFEEVPVDE